MGNLFICELALIMDMMIPRLPSPTATTTVAATATAAARAATTAEACTASFGEAPRHSAVVIATECTRAYAALLAPRLRIATSGTVAPAKGIGRGTASVSSAFGTLPGGTTIAATIGEATARGIG
jgi:hypothetical protein